MGVARKKRRVQRTQTLPPPVPTEQKTRSCFITINSIALWGYMGTGEKSSRPIQLLYLYRTVLLSCNTILLYN